MNTATHVLDADAIDALPSPLDPCPDCGNTDCHPDPWGESESCADRADRRRALQALEAQRREAHALTIPAAAARTRYKRLARRGEPHPNLIPALDEAIRLSCQRRDLLERIALDSDTLARTNTTHPDHATLAQQAADDRAALERCHDVDRLRARR